MDNFNVFVDKAVHFIVVSLKEKWILKCCHLDTILIWNKICAEEMQAANEEAGHIIAYQSE